MATRVNVPVQMLAPVPDVIGATTAASVPTAVLTVLLAYDWAKLGPGDRVLVHAASGGVGLAAVQLAQRRGAVVFATASTYKRETLRQMGVEHVYDSRSTDFADQILADTDGAGVDVVINSLTSEEFRGGDGAGDRSQWPVRRDREARHLDHRADDRGETRHRVRDPRA